MKIEKIGREIGKFLSDHAPAILTSVGAAGVLSTAVLAVRATPHAMSVIWDAESGGDVATPVDKVKLTWRLYLPAAASGVLAITAIIAAHNTHTKRNAALMSAYTLAERAYQEYREEVIQQQGENTDRKIKENVAEKRMDDDPVTNNQVIITGSGESLCYDSISGRYFKSDIETIRKAQNDINYSVLNHMYVSHNDFYRAIGLDPVALGEELGWTTSNTMEIDFSSHLSDDGRPCLYLDYAVAPIRDYYKFN